MWERVRERNGGRDAEEGGRRMDLSGIPARLGTAEHAAQVARLTGKWPVIAERGEQPMAWLKLVLFALALERPGCFVQVAVPHEAVGQIEALAERQGFRLRVGPSLTPAYRIVTLWLPRREARVEQGAQGEQGKQREEA